MWPENITKYLLSKQPNSDIERIDIAPNMVKLAKQNNSKASFYEMDIRSINTLKTNYDGIICGFGLPYLSKKDCNQLIQSCFNLLKPIGILYISFVEGDYKDSSYISGNTGDKLFLYYHNLEYLKQLLAKHNFHLTNILYVDYLKNSLTKEVHTILIAKK